MAVEAKALGYEGGPWPSAARTVVVPDAEMLEMSPPCIEGDRTVGEVLTTVRGETGVSWTTYSYAWYRCHALLPDQRDATWLAILDFSWPLSMLIIGVTIAVTGRWRGLARAWSLVAETWVLVTIPALGLLGQTGSTVVGVAHLFLGYTVLGLILASRPALVVTS